MGCCFQSRDKKNTDQLVVETKDAETNQDLKNKPQGEKQKIAFNEPSISIDEDNSSNSPMNHFDEQIRKCFFKNLAKPKILKKNIHRDYSPKRTKEQKFDDVKQSSSQKCIDGNQIPKNKLFHQKYQQINRIRMKNKINNHISELQQANLQNHQIQIPQQMIIEPFHEQEESEASQYSRKNSESQRSRLSEIVIICYSCHTKIQSNIFQPECLHHYHQNCLSELITQQIIENKVQINCICNQVIPTKFLAFVLKQQNENDHQNQGQEYLETYFKNQYNFLTQNLY